METKIKKTRNRGVLLDPIKVRLAASKINFKTCTELKEHYLEYHNKYDTDTKVVYHAWNGSTKIAIDSAKKIAKSLELDDYSVLLPDESIASAWQQLIFNDDYQDQFIDFIDHSKLDLNLVQFSQDDHEDLPKVPLNAKWHIELQGKKGETVFMILRSEELFFQLAPVEIHSNQFIGKSMRYPQSSSLAFNEKYGTGWRQLIVVRAKHIKQQAKNEHTGYLCTINDLNSFALQTMGISRNAIAVDKYEFMLIEP